MELKALLPSYNSDINVLLFDLDDTLVKITNWELLKFIFYIKAMVRFRKIISPFLFYKYFSSAVKKIKTNSSNIKNGLLFKELLANYSNKSIHLIEKTIQDFIQKDFVKLKKFFRPIPEAKKAIKLAQKLGYKLVLATNPTMPLETVSLRIKWANLDKIKFNYITHSDIMTRCKPNPEFYFELLHLLKIKNTQCLMVGNDFIKDFSAQKAGIPTFIINSRHSRKQLKYINKNEIEGWGSYQDLSKWLKNNKKGNH